jgi:2-hydroxy-3-keto-5-methylthiopentenyl-1-phosphate phosphatase
MDDTSKILIQCDFDGTITEEDVSVALLDVHVGDSWRRLLEEYREGRLSVGAFNSRAFAMIKDDKDTLLGTVWERAKIRAGFHEFVDYCIARGFRLVTVSNGLDFYIEAILRRIGLGKLEFFASQTSFHPEGLEVEYTGPDGSSLNDGFKEAYVTFFLRRGYQVVYIGDGLSDMSPASKCHHVFATGDLLARCREMNLVCTPFTDFHDVIKSLDTVYPQNVP